MKRSLEKDINEYCLLSSRNIDVNETIENINDYYWQNIQSEPNVNLNQNQTEKETQQKMIFDIRISQTLNNIPINTLHTENDAKKFLIPSIIPLSNLFFQHLKEILIT